MICGTDKNSNKLWEILNLGEYDVIWVSKKMSLFC